MAFLAATPMVPMRAVMHKRALLPPDSEIAGKKWLTWRIRYLLGTKSSPQARSSPIKFAVWYS
jgi:hypothetical protein